MKVVLLAGGLGTRLAEETEYRPKPMVEIGGMPLLWHIMKQYSHFGFNDFVILLGYKGFVIKEFFANYFLHSSNVTIDIKSGSIDLIDNSSEPWKVTLIDTGHNSMTGGRIKRVQSIIGNEPFMLTYGDGVSNVNIKDLVKFHKSHGKAITVTAAQPEGRFGSLYIENDHCISSFSEKPKGDGGWINAGFFVCEPKVFDYITQGDSSIFEQEPLKNMAADGELFAYQHTGFWKPMDTLRDKISLQKLWDDNSAPWKIW
jgi:glucose-1-phosphate cytidylyltransferase